MSDLYPIRTANSEDSLAIAKVHVSSWQTSYRGILEDRYLDNLSVRDREKMWARGLSKEESRQIVFVAEDGSKVIGFASGGPEISEKTEYAGELYAIYIFEEYQRKGIGRRLTRKIVDGLIDEDMNSMLIWVLAESPYRVFYEGLGGEMILEKEYDVGGQIVQAVGYGWKELINSNI